MTELNIRDLEDERDEILRFFKKQLEKFRYLKRDIEKSEWSDSNYDELIVSMNAIGKALSEAVLRLTNGDNAYIIDELLPLAKSYVAVADAFPKIS